MNNNQTNNIATLALGAVLILAGLLFLVGQFVGARFWELAWPFTILIPGLLLFVGMVAGGKSTGGLAIPASIVTTLGLLMLFQNTFNYFESWAYAWALIPTAVGVGMMINGVWSDQPGLVEKGRKTAQIGAVMFAIGFVFFELVVRIGRFGHIMFGGFLGPLVLILIGGYLLFRNLVDGSNRSLRQASTLPPPPVGQPTPKSVDVAAQPSSAVVNRAEPPTAAPPLTQEPAPVQSTEPPGTASLIDGQEKDKIVIM
ncbi:MAG: hypothetical protein U0175_18815 [Caldilineaceae bacterium]